MTSQFEKCEDVGPKQAVQGLTVKTAQKPKEGRSNVYFFKSHRQ